MNLGVPQGEDLVEDLGLDPSVYLGVEPGVDPVGWYWFRDGQVPYDNPFRRKKKQAETRKGKKTELLIRCQSFNPIVTTSQGTGVHLPLRTFPTRWRPLYTYFAIKNRNSLSIFWSTLKEDIFQIIRIQKLTSTPNSHPYNIDINYRFHNIAH